MNSTDTIRLKEADVIRLIESYLDSRGFHMTLDALERETGIINEEYPADVLMLRSLILEGRWQEAVRHIKALPLSESDVKFAVFEMMKQKYVELICVYEELGNELYEDLGNAVAVCFSELSSYCPCPAEYGNLRKLSSLTKLSQDENYQNWNPFTSRRQCFQAIVPVLLDKPGLGTRRCQDSQRLTDILVKGLLYDSCQEYCLSKARGQSDDVPFRFTTLDENAKSTEFSLCLYSWLKSIPWNIMARPFVLNSLNVQIDGVEKPTFKERWTEIILQNSDDLPEEVVKELKNPEAEIWEFRERFWNRRIENKMILDTTDILKKAEGVIQRWEKLNFGKVNRLQGNEMNTAAYTSRSDVDSGTPLKLLHSKGQTFAQSTSTRTVSFNLDSNSNFENSDKIGVKYFYRRGNVANEEFRHTNETVLKDPRDLIIKDHFYDGRKSGDDKITSSAKTFNRGIHCLSEQKNDSNQESVYSTTFPKNGKTLINKEKNRRESKTSPTLSLDKKSPFEELNSNSQDVHAAELDQSKKLTASENKKLRVDTNRKLTAGNKKLATATKPAENHSNRNETNVSGNSFNLRHDLEDSTTTKRRVLNQDSADLERQKYDQKTVHSTKESEDKNNLFEEKQATLLHSNKLEGDDVHHRRNLNSGVTASVRGRMTPARCSSTPAEKGTFQKETIKCSMVNGVLNQDAKITFSDEERSVRNLLRAKEIIREKLLNILKDKEDDEKYSDNRSDDFLTSHTK